MNCLKNKDETTEQGIYNRRQLHAMWFIFMPGKGPMDVIFIARQLQERFLEKKLYFAFVDLEKAFDQILREVKK